MIGPEDMVVRLFVSCVLGGIVGYERQSRNKSAGLRTHILVCLGSCLVMVLSIDEYSSVQGLTNADPGRLAAQVVSGIGFLGAGTIMKEGLTVRGLTTAASLWVVAGIGLAVGSSCFLGAFVTTGFVFLTLSILSKIEIFSSNASWNLVIQTVNIPGQIGKICSSLSSLGAVIREMKIDNKNLVSDIIEIQFYIYLTDTIKIDEILTLLIAIEGITAVDSQGN
jgi:putative Mg2+ transporter-C (MgtC) family protein